MLDTMRKNSKSALIYIIFGGIIVTFVFSFGPGSSGCHSSGTLTKGAPVAARVNGETIPLSDFQQSYTHVFKDYQRRSKGAFTEELASSLRLKDQVLDQLIGHELLVQAAHQRGIAVSDQELAQTIRREFAPEGKFDEGTYRLIVERQLGMTTWQFEEQERRRLLVNKMVASMMESAKVADDEVRAEFLQEKERLNLAFVRFPSSSYKAQVERPNDAAIDEFLKTHAAQVEEAYKSNSFRYHKPKRVRARHILIKVDGQASGTALEAARQKLNEVKKKIAGGADFAAEAKALSEDLGTKDKGGDLGVFGPGTMDPAFEKAAFGLQANQVSDPVRSRFGLHLIKVEELVPEENKALKDVERELAAELMVDDAAKAMARKKAEETLAKVREGKKLEELWPERSEKKDDAKAEAVKAKADLEQPATEVTGPFFPVDNYIPRIGADAALTQAALALDEKKPAADKVFEVNGSAYLVSLKSRERADMKEFEAKIDEYRQKARQRKGNELLDGLLKGLKEKANIEKNEALVQGPAPVNPTSAED